MALKKVLFTIAIISICFISTQEIEPSNGLENSPLSKIRGVVGGDAILSCHMEGPSEEDVPILVLFYKGEQRTPIFSVDSRDSSIYDASSWNNPDLKDRVSLQVTRNSQGLLLRRLRLTDAGLYRCRVDFKASPTRNSRVRLQVIEPPRHIMITNSYDNSLMKNNVIGPFQVGSEITLSCQATGGHPRPQVSWWEQGKLLDNVSELASGEVTRNIYSLSRLTRSDLLKVVTCQAYNSNLTTPLSTSVTIDLAFPPRFVRISSKDQDLAPESKSRGKQVITVYEGQPSPLQCRVIGSRPPPVITWKLNGRSVNSEFETISSPTMTDSGSVSVSSSTLMLSASSVDDQSLVSCKAASPAILHESMDDSVHLNVLYKPIIKMSVVGDANIEDVEEGQTIIFKCDVEANPPVAQIQWTLNSIPLHHNVTQGVLIIDQNSSLVLKRISRQLSGRYSCASANSRGSAMSNVVDLRIKYAPRCSPFHKSSVGIGRAEKANITCTVDAHPPATTFRWVFNATTELYDIPYDHQVHTNGTTSTIAYVPRAPNQYGTLLCWATNPVGVLKNPCQISVLPIDKPEAVIDCKLRVNVTDKNEPVFLSCEPGWDGGLRQTFTLEVRKASRAHARVLTALQHESKPEFLIRNLAQGEEYLFTVTAANPRGTSPPVTLSYNTPEKTKVGSTFAHSHKKNFFETMMPYIVILMVSVVTITICVSGIACLAKSHAAKKAKSFNNQQSKYIQENASSPGKCSVKTFKEDQISKCSDSLSGPSRFSLRESGAEENHYCQQNNEDPETRALLKSAFGGSAGTDRIEYPFTLRASSSMGTPRFLDPMVPIVATDSMSGCSTLSTLSTTSRKTIRSSPSLNGGYLEVSNVPSLSETPCSKDSLLGTFKSFTHRKGYLKQPCECGIDTCPVPRESSV